MEHLTENVAKMRDSRLNMNTERVVETFSMVISKVKLDLMDNSSTLARQLNQIFFESVDYSHLFDGSLTKAQKQRILRVAVQKIDKFIMEWLLNLAMIELDDVLNPVDGDLLLRLVGRLQRMVNLPWGRLDRTPKELLHEFIQLKPTLSVDDGLTFGSSLLRRLAPNNYRKN